MATNLGVFRFQPLAGEDTIANDGSSFGAPYFSQARSMLQSICVLALTPETITYPENYELDAVQEEREDHFEAKEWILAAITVGEYGTPRKALLVHLTHHDEGYLLDLTNGTVIARFYRGFEIQEFPGDVFQDGSLFLTSIGIQEEQYRVQVSDADFDDLDEDDEEAPVIEISKPSFAPVSKKKIVNLGGSYNAIADVDEDEEVEIEVERPAFEANSKSKIRNLGSSGQDRKRREIKEEEERDVHIEVERPAFTASSNKKPRNLNAKPDRPKPVKAAPAAEPEEKPVEITPITPEFSPVQKQGKPRNLDEKKPVKPVEKPEEAPQPSPKDIQIERPAFSAHRGGKPKNLDRKEEKGQSIIVEPIGFKPAKKEEVAPVVEEKNWVPFDALKLKPRVFQGERAVIHEKGNEHVKPFFASALAQLKDISSLRISKNCVFVPEVLGENDPHVLALNAFNVEDYDILALTLDREERPIYALLADKKEKSMVLQVSFKHKGPHLVVLSLKGASVDDRALPYYAYADLRKLCEVD